MQFEKPLVASEVKGIISNRVPDGQKKNGGIAKLVESIKLGNGYNNTEKFLIVGKSGAGKTTLAFDLALTMIKNYCCIVYICSHFNDNIVKNMEEWCKEAAMPFFEISVGNDGSLNVPDLERALFIIDDYYTSTKRPLSLEYLIKILVNKGRHKENHLIYIAHSPKYLPTEIMHNNSGVFVDRTYEKFPVSNFINKKNTGNQWYMITDDALSSDATIRPISFENFDSENLIIKRLKSKIPKEDKGKKLPDINDFKLMEKQGNEESGKVASSMNKLNFINKINREKKNDRIRAEDLPMFGDISNQILNKDNKKNYLKGFLLDNIYGN